MRVFYAGTPAFSAVYLEHVARNHYVCGVLTQPDKRAGRGRRKFKPLVKDKAMELGLKLFQPEKLDVGVLEEIKKLKPDILVAVAIGRIFSREFLNLFPKGGINLHPSLLPKFRGPSPIPAALLSGENKTGITIQKMALRMDSGAIIIQEDIPLDKDSTSASVMDEVARMGPQILLKALDDIEKGNTEAIPQNESEATYCHLVKKEHGCINWNQNAAQIERMVRAYLPWPKAYTFWQTNRVTILKAAVHTGSPAPDTVSVGTVYSTEKKFGFMVKTGSGILNIQELQLEYKKPAVWSSFLNGYPEIVGSTLGG